MTTPHGIPESNHPSPQQIATAIALLADDAGGVHASARERLLDWGEAAVEQLESAAEADSLLVRLRSREVLRAIDVRRDLDRLAALDFVPRGRGASSVLVHGASLLSRMVRTFVPPSEVLLRRLRRHAMVLRRQFAGRSLPTCARLLAERLHDHVGLKGYSELGGSACVPELDQLLLDRVLDVGVGMPVSLSMIYLLVARQAGLSVAGVALPGHFLVRLHGRRPVLVDPYHAGRTITKTDCARYLRANGYEQVGQHLRDLDDREVLVHYVRALQRAARSRATGQTRHVLAEARTVLASG